MTTIFFLFFLLVLDTVVVESGIRDRGSEIWDRESGIWEGKISENSGFGTLKATIGLLQSFVLLGITSFGERTCGNGEIQGGFRLGADIRRFPLVAGGQSMFAFVHNAST